MRVIGAWTFPRGGVDTMLSHSKQTEHTRKNTTYTQHGAPHTENIHTWAQSTKRTRRAKCELRVHACSVRVVYVMYVVSVPKYKHILNISEVRQRMAQVAGPRGVWSDNQPNTVRHIIN